VRRNILLILFACLLLTVPVYADTYELPALGDGWYVPNQLINGTSVRLVDGKLIISATTGEFPLGDGIPMAIRLGSVQHLGNVVPDSQEPDGVFKYPTDGGFLAELLAPGALVQSDLPGASPMAGGMDRQPVLSNGADTAGSLTAAPQINVLQRLFGVGYELTPNQVQWVQGLAGKAVPGTLYITVRLVPSASGWRISRWVYTFDPNLQAVVDAMPPDDPEPPTLPPPPPLANYQGGTSEVLILPADCNPNPDHESPIPCLNYPHRKARWWCKANPTDPDCR
jgi:hypothetical protein